MAQMLPVWGSKRFLLPGRETLEVMIALVVFGRIPFMPSIYTSETTTIR